MTIGSTFAKAMPCLAAAALLVCASGAGQAEEKAADAGSKTLRVCASSEEAPFSSADETGFENKIAKIVADEMGREAEFVWMEKPAIYLVRDLLNEKKCDVVIGLDAGDPRVLTTQAYYRAPYVFVTRAESDLKIDDFDSPDLAKAAKIGFDPGSPAETMLKKVGLYNRNFNYHRSLTNFKSRRNQYVRIDPKRFVSDVASGEADVAIVFAPEVARYVIENDDVKMTVVPDANYRVDDEKVPFHFDQSMGVRKGDTELLSELNEAIEKSQPKLEEVLKEEGIPLRKTSVKPSRS